MFPNYICLTIKITTLLRPIEKYEQCYLEELELEPNICDFIKQMKCGLACDQIENCSNFHLDGNY